jgi:hypothetical protein
MAFLKGTPPETSMQHFLELCGDYLRDAIATGRKFRWVSKASDRGSTVISLEIDPPTTLPEYTIIEPGEARPQ